MSGDSNYSHIRRVTWQEIGPAIKEVNAELWNALNPVMSKLKKGQGRSPQFVVAEYPYGNLLVECGQFRLPCVDQSSACSTDCKEIASELDYSYIPLGLVLDKSVEVFVMRDGGYTAPSGKRNVPLRILSKGELFGVFETFDRLTNMQNPKPHWSVSSGARSVVIIAPLGDQGILNKIDNGLRCSVPRGSNRHDWEFIQCIVERTPQIAWKVQVLLFPKWVIKDDEILAPLRKVISGTGWHQMAPLRNFVIDEADIAKVYMQHLLANDTGHASELYYYFTVRHILAISKGEMPAFQPVASELSQTGPFLEFQDIMKSINVLKYFPVVLQPGLLSEPGAVGYYSINQPSLLSPVPNKFPQKTRKAMVDEFHTIIDRLPGKTLAEAYLDFKQTRFYSDWGQYYLKGNRRMPVEKNIEKLRSADSRLRFLEALEERKGEFIPPNFMESSTLDEPQRLNFGHKFFNGAIRIVRK